MSILSNQAFAAVLGKGGRRFTRPSEGDGVSNLLLAFRRHVSLPPSHRDTKSPPGKIRKHLQEVPLFDADGAGFGFLVKLRPGKLSDLVERGCGRYAQSLDNIMSTNPETRSTHTMRNTISTRSGSRTMHHRASARLWPEQ